MLPADIPVRQYPTIDSTNLEARRLFEGGQSGPVWLLADEQTAGRGRLGREWKSLQGNLYSTLLLPVAAPAAMLPQLGFAVALSVHDAVRDIAPSADVSLKWPNDCLIAGAKASGILCEVLSLAPAVVALGCGINVAHAPSDLAYPATCLAAFTPSATVALTFETYSKYLTKWLSAWRGGEGFAVLAAAWNERATGIGETVTFTTSTEQHTGTFKGIAADGAILLVLAGGAERAFHAGDLAIPSLQHLRSQA